jgi:hypothetical protein
MAIETLGGAPPDRPGANRLADWIPRLKLSNSHPTPNTGTSHCPGRSLTTRPDRTDRRGNILMMIVVVAAVIGLIRLASHVTRNAHAREPVGGAADFMVIRTELLCLWFPRTLTELAILQAQSPLVRTYDDLQQFLDLRHQHDLWYALTIRGHQANGAFSDVTYIRWANDSLYFRELLDFLSTAAGNPPYYPTSDLSSTSVHVIADEFLKREPREVMAELLGYRAPAADRERSP